MRGDFHTQTDFSDCKILPPACKHPLRWESSALAFTPESWTASLSELPSPWGPADLRHGDNSGTCPALWVPGGRWDLVPGFCSVKPILSVFPSKSGAKHEFCPSSPKVCCQGALEISASGQALKLSLSLSSTTSFGSRKSCSCNCKLSSVRKGGNVVLSTEIFIDLFLPVPVGQTLQLARRASYVF